MGLLTFLIDFIIHIDKYIDLLINTFGVFSYVILFCIVFLETGIVLAPFLPGDSLLFVTGTFAALGSLNIFILFFVFLAAAIIGDSVNYWIGDFFGEKVFNNWKFFRKEHLNRTKKFFKKHGGKTILLARFVPIVRTFAPFVAGVGKMHYRTFLFFNVIGAILWVSLFLLSGYFFGRLSFVKENLTLFIILIVFVSLIPMIIEYFRSRKKK